MPRKCLKIGNVVFLEEILDASQEEMHTHMKKQEVKYAQIEDPVAVSDNIGLSAIVVQDMSARRHKDYAFDWYLVCLFNNPGPVCFHSKETMAHTSNTHTLECDQSRE